MGESELLDAARRGDQHTLVQLLQDGAPVNQVTLEAGGPAHSRPATPGRGSSQPGNPRGGGTSTPSSSYSRTGLQSTR